MTPQRRLTPALIRQMDLHKSLRDVLLEVIRLAHGRAAIRITQAALALRLGVSERSVRRHLAGLEGMGLIKRLENRCVATGYRGSTTIQLVENAWSITPRNPHGQPAKLSARNDSANRSGCPHGQPAKLSAIIEDSSKSGIRDTESRSRDEDVSRGEAHDLAPVGDGPNLILLSGGKAA